MTTQVMKQWTAPRISDAIEALRMWRRRARTRRTLAELSTRELRDVGIDRATAYLESEKPFWRS